VNFVDRSNNSQLITTPFLLLITSLGPHEIVLLLKELSFLKKEIRLLYSRRIASISENCRCILVLF
ncbi:MAG: hypothetical protein ACXACB_06075, partial [Promethearchaeota archaeon]